MQEKSSTFFIFVKILFQRLSPSLLPAGKRFLFYFIIKKETDGHIRFPLSGVPHGAGRKKGLPDGEPFPFLKRISAYAAFWAFWKKK